MMRDVRQMVSDGLLGNPAPKGEGLHVKIGASPMLAEAPLLITADMSASKIRARLGHCPLADAVMDSVDFGANRLYCIPASASTAGSVGAITKEGAGTGSVTISGSPTNAFDLLVKITAQGALNAAAFTYSIDGGYRFSAEQTVPIGGAYALPNTGLKLLFAEVAQEEDKASSFLVGDIYAAKCSAPTMTGADVLAAIRKLSSFAMEYEFVHIVGESVASLWAAVGTAQLELSEKHKKPLFFIMEAYTPQSGEELLDYALRLEADRRGLGNYNLQVVAARGVLVKMDGQTQETNLAGLICGLYAKAPVQVCIGKTRPEAGFAISEKRLLELRPVGIEAVTEVLDLADFLTLRRYDGLSGFYVYHTKMLSPPSSDYRYAEDVRVLNKILRETRKEALLLLQDDIDLEDVQGELETRGKFLFAALQRMIDAREISAATITVPEGQEETILQDEIMRVNIRYGSRGYIREIVMDIGRAGAGS